jgi:hypothetical protein
MKSKILFVAATLALGATRVALAASAPSSTDEARSSAAVHLSPACPQPPSAAAPSTSDEARADIAAALDEAAQSVPSAHAPQLLSRADDTDAARATAAAEVDETPTNTCTQGPALGT